MLLPMKENECNDWNRKKSVQSGTEEIERKPTAMSLFDSLYSQGSIGSMCMRERRKGKASAKEESREMKPSYTHPIIRFLNIYDDRVGALLGTIKQQIHRSTAQPKEIWSLRIYTAVTARWWRC